MMKASLITAQFTAIALCTTQAGVETVVLRFGLYAADKQSKLIGQFRPILNFLEKIIAVDRPRRSAGANGRGIAARIASGA